MTEPNQGFVAPVSRPTASAPPPERRISQFEESSETAKQVAKLTARMNASAVTDAEREALLAERASLLDKKFATTMTREESSRLDYVRWSLDRIDDAKHGEALDKLETKIGEIKKLSDELQGLFSKLEGAAHPPRRK
jgi:hypothetical protein